MSVLDWISEGEALPIIGQTVIVAHPRQVGEFWDVKIQCILARHEGVLVRPVKAGERWPTDYYWGDIRNQAGTNIITGNSWWAYLDGINLPLGAEHQIIRDYRCIVQPEPIWIPQAINHDPC